jgi:hypothetical protein
MKVWALLPHAEVICPPRRADPLWGTLKSMAVPRFRSALPAEEIVKGVTTVPGFGSVTLNAPVIESPVFLTRSEPSVGFG